MCKSSKFWLNMVHAIRNCSLERAGEGQTCINELWKVLVSAAEWQLPAQSGDFCMVGWCFLVRTGRLMKKRYWKSSSEIFYYIELRMSLWRGGVLGQKVNLVAGYFLSIFLELVMSKINLILESIDLWDPAGGKGRLGAHLGRCSSLCVLTGGRNDSRWQCLLSFLRNWVQDLEYTWAKMRRWLEFGCYLLSLCIATGQWATNQPQPRVYSVSGLECLSKVEILVALQVERKVVKHNFAKLRKCFKIKIVNLKNKEKLFLEKY